MAWPDPLNSNSNAASDLPLPDWSPNAPSSERDRVVELGFGRQIFRDLIEDSPSWLVSLVVHLVVFLIIASMTVPWKPSSGIPGNTTGTVEVTLGFTDKMETAQGDKVTLEPKPNELPQDDPQPTEETESNEPKGKPDVEKEGRPPQATSTAARTSSQSQPQAQSSSSFPDAPSPSDTALKLSPYAAILNQTRASQTPSAAVSFPVVAMTTSVDPLTPVPVDPVQAAFDRIVDDFIAYDIGQLRGAAGQAARRRFSQLGADSIPALVRGLNKSASIAASCPVGVIAGKLMTTLRQTNDASLRQYALDHVGEGVPENAPHFHRLVALRKRWLQGPKMPQRVANYVQRMESRSEGELMELMLALSDSTSDIIAAALRSDDEYLAGAAVLAIIQTRQAWDLQQKAKLRAAVNNLKNRTDKKQLKHLAKDAASSLR